MREGVIRVLEQEIDPRGLLVDIKQANGDDSDEDIDPNLEE